VPSVASEVNASLSLSQSQKWRSQPSSSDSASQPFASLLDATATAPEATSEPDVQDQAQRTEPSAATSSPNTDTTAGTAVKSASVATDGSKSTKSTNDAPVANKKDDKEADKDSKAVTATAKPDTTAKAEDVPATTDDDKDKDSDGKDATTSAAAPTPALTTPQPVATVVAVTSIVTDPTAPASDADTTGTIDADKAAKPVVLDPAAAATGDAKDAAAGDSATAAATPAPADGNAATPTSDGKPATDAKAQATSDSGKPADGTGDKSSKGVHTDTAKAVAQTDSGHSDARHEATPDLDAQSATAGAADDQQQATVKPNADAVPNFGFSASSTAATAAPTTAAATPTVTVPIAGLAVEIAARAQAGSNRFDIRLDPPELGRIDVRLDVDRDGQVTSHVTVDRPETLALLKHEQPNLERALEQSGLKTADNGLQFTLRDQSFAGQDNGGRSGQNTARIVIPDADLSTVETVSSRYRSFGVGGGVDISV
jgi:flagellar hook-length control protein FliK